MKQGYTAATMSLQMWTDAQRKEWIIARKGNRKILDDGMDYIEQEQLKKRISAAAAAVLCCAVTPTGAFVLQQTIRTTL